MRQRAEADCLDALPKFVVLQTNRSTRGLRHALARHVTLDAPSSWAASQLPGIMRTFTVSMAMSHSVPIASTVATNFVSEPRRRTLTCTRERTAGVTAPPRKACGRPPIVPQLRPARGKTADRHLGVVVYAVRVCENATIWQQEPRPAAAELPLALPRQTEVRLAVHAEHLQAQQLQLMSACTPQDSEGHGRVVVGSASPGSCFALFTQTDKVSSGVSIVSNRQLSIRSTRCS